MLGSESIIGYERLNPSARREVSDKVSVSLGTSQVEPAAMQVKDCGALLSPRRFRPPPGDPTDRIGFEGHIRGNRDSLHHRVERTASGRPRELPLEWRDAGSQGGRSEGILLAERMNSQPRRFR